MLMCCGKEAKREGQRCVSFFTLLLHAYNESPHLRAACEFACHAHLSPSIIDLSLQGCAVVEFESAEQAAEAINTLHLSEVRK